LNKLITFNNTYFNLCILKNSNTISVSKKDAFSYLLELPSIEVNKELLDKENIEFKEIVKEIC